MTVLKNSNSKALLVLFDDCWNGNYHSGQQPAPIPGVHNSQWVQCPGDIKHDESVYEDYVKTILTTFGSS